MDYQQKYVEYKDKYMRLKNHYMIGGNNPTYQDIIYNIAKYIKPNKLEKFRKEYGMKQLSNQVIELNKNNYLSDLHNNMTDYYITDKIDGKRTILYLTDRSSYAVSDILEKIDIHTKDITILDTEMYEGDYYIFDIMVYYGKSLMDIPFEERIRYFDKFGDMSHIRTKPFIRLNDRYKDQIKKFKKNKKEYEIDGIIFTPANGLYNTMKVYKYKPLERMTVDFLIKRCPIESEKLYNQKNKDGNMIYLLFCGISKKVFYKLRLYLIKYYEKLFPNIDTENLPHYLPIQFMPSSQMDAYLFWSNDAGLDGQIGEFLYDIISKKWILKKIREDRQVEVLRGNYFGNNYKIAELIWMAYNDPLIIENIDEEQSIYFQQHDNPMQKATRNFNSYVKSEIFKKFRGTEWTMDMASGKGQDLFRYSANMMKNVIFLEIDKTALAELISRKHIFSNDDKYRNKMNILIQNIDLANDYRDNIMAIDNVYPHQNIDLIMCNFAFHYLMKNKKSLENICKLIDHYLKKNGSFVFTAFDGHKIIDLLKKNDGEWIVSIDDSIKYGIKKKYSKDRLLSIGQKIEVLLPFSKNTYYEEYLINIDTIVDELKKYNILLQTNESFSKYIRQYHGHLDSDDRTYVDLYHYYIFIKK